jgi:hypothetical protein
MQTNTRLDWSPCDGEEKIRTQKPLCPGRRLTFCQLLYNSLTIRAEETLIQFNSSHRPNSQAGKLVNWQEIASNRREQNSDLQDHNHTNLDVRPGVMGLRQSLQQSHYPSKPIQDPSHDSRRTMVCHKCHTVLRPRDTYRTRRHPSQNQKIPHQTSNPQKSALKDAADTKRHQTTKTILANRPELR